jgi:hypothetical protein
MPRKSTANINAAFKALMPHNATPFAMIRMSRFVYRNGLSKSVAGVFAGFKIPLFDEIRKGMHVDYLAEFDIGSDVCNTESRY